MATVRLLLGDQLNPEHSWFGSVDPAVVYVLMEVRTETDYVVHHAQKVIAIFAGMRRLAANLRTAGHRMRYFRISDADNRQGFAENLRTVLAEVGATRFEYQEPDEWRLDEALRAFAAATGLPGGMVSSEHFLDGRGGVAAHFQKDAKRWLMESYYRRMRVRTKLLLEADGSPLGGEWNYDKENRKPWKGTPPPPKPWDVRHDHRALWVEIQAAGVRTMGSPGAEEFPWPRDRAEALAQLAAFIERGLPDFGDYEDAMHTSSDRLFHSRLSFALNVKLLAPREVADAAAAAHRRDPARYPLAATEGFVRQIIGWREYIRGVYWAKMPGYAAANGLGHSLSLPAWFWTGAVKMNCLRHAIAQSLDTAYAHHIQRLMVIGSFCLTAGISPAEVEKWYLGVYIDAFQWVELPNVIGMSQHADGGFLASKPYCCAASYVSKMSNYCGGCPYDPKDRTGPLACPLNALYWDFWLRHQDRFLNNPRVGMAVRQAAQMPPAEQAAIRRKAAELRAGIEGL
ncbi:cryptochrome/photolyase family protein [Verrucomicrobiota bacterium]|nr:(6-4) photolyase [Verrucomicrobiota bacterium]GDY17306.1 cryptochrome/photolyase family protein [Verrucomicrobiota bacterium]